MIMIHCPHRLKVNLKEHTLCVIIACAASKGSLHYCKVQTYKHGIKSFKYQGINILNDLKKWTFTKIPTVNVIS